MSKYSPAVVAALAGLGADLGVAQKANLPGRTHDQLIRRALDNFDLRLEKAGLAPDGITKLADSSDFVGKSVNPHYTEQVAEIIGRLEKVEGMAMPSGPALRRPAEPVQKSVEQREADRFEMMAQNVSDPVLRRGYEERARQLRELP